ncbi:hypothetical protein BH09MYX1_BH09MYX1_46880 [soil metagenome]
MTLPPDHKARMLAALAKTPAPTRAQMDTRARTAWAGAIALSLLLFVASGFRLGTRPMTFIAVSAAGWAVLGVLALAFSFVLGRSMLGRDTRTLRFVLAGAPMALVWMLVCLQLWPAAGDGEAPGLAHVACFVYSLFIASGPFAAMAWLRRGSDPVKPRLTLAAYGAAAGLLAGVLMDVHCAYANLEHVVIGHVLPVVGFVGVGWLLGERLLGVAAKPD